MSIYLRIILFVICLVIVPTGLFAQTGDICSKLPAVESLRSLNANVASAGTNSDIIVQQMRERADMQARQEQERATWTAQMFPVKYLDSAETLKALCIFSAEIVPQPTIHMISVRAAQTSMAAIGDAIKRLDVPQIGPKSAELTIYVLVASDQDETLRPFPASLKPVVDQLKAVLSYKQFYLLDTLMATSVDNRHVQMSGDVRGLSPAPAPGQTPRDTNYIFRADVRIGNGEQATALVRLSSLNLQIGSMSISTDVDIPQGKQVVVGRATSGDRAFILVVSAKILN